jgi:hypothetical protein
MILDTYKNRFKELLDVITRFYIGYFCVILVGIQTIINNVALFFPDYYSATIEFHLNQLFGANFMTALLMIFICTRFNLCRWSWACAIAEVLFYVINVTITDDLNYNIALQIIIGIISLIISYYENIIKWAKQINIKLF